MRQHGGSPEARQFQQLIIGPWKHGLPLGSVSGDMAFGIMAESFAIDLEGIHLRWYDHWLKGADNGVRNDAPVRLFVMGHQPAEMGYFALGESMLVIGSDHDHGQGLPIDLARRYQRDDLVRELVPLASVVVGSDT